MASPLQQQFERKEMELRALLEITQAINANLPQESLYKIFKFTAISNLRLTRLCLFVQEERWMLRASHGNANFPHAHLPGESFTALRSITRMSDLANAGSFSVFDLVVPVWHQEKLLALVFAASEDPDNMDSMGFLQALGNIVMVAMQNKRLQERELQQEVFRREMEIARDVQQRMFPENLPGHGRVVLKATYLPHDRVGGDYYDYIPLGADRFMLCIADVSGKGIGAAMLMSNFQASLRTLVRQTQDLGEIIRTLNEQVIDTARGEGFITFFSAIYHLADRCLTYVNAGHNPPLLWTSDRRVQSLQEGCTVLGAVRHLPSLQTGQIKALDDFMLCCYTDGLTETVNEQGQEFGLQPVVRQLEKTAQPEPMQLNNDLIVALDGFKGRNAYRDDITLLSCRVRNRITS